MSRKSKEQRGMEILVLPCPRDTVLMKSGVMQLVAWCYGYMPTQRKYLVRINNDVEIQVQYTGQPKIWKEV
jgi:hypothetical protein